uniref:Uncharacterized protein n=1 Tax=Oryza sativa subsp. japonica TaxID=39947 RepID=Q6ZLJ5_ORYSJ|nr:hypothetical protein [Oryza sativa Japonica Group]BAD30812.1 hypothetical protein [Oryza sativa Japonica Group]
MASDIINKSSCSKFDKEKPDQEVVVRTRLPRIIRSLVVFDRVMAMQFDPDQLMALRQ